MYFKSKVALVGVVAAFGLADARAADQPAAEAADQLDEVVVTAERRGENTQTTPIAITALQGSDLPGKGVASIEDLQYASPAVTIGDNGNTNAVNIRGVGLTSDLPNVSNGVATYIDGLFQPQIVTNGRFYDVQDVEVLRGPQGTLVGSNSTGGAVFINTQSPKIGKDEGYVTAGAGNYGESDAQAALNLPVNDILALRVAGDYVSRDSFYKSVGPVYTDAGMLVEKSGRLGVLFQPGSLKVLAKAEYLDRSTGGYTGTPIPGTTYAAFAPQDPFTLDFGVPTLDHETSLELPLELRYEFADGITLRSMSGYQDKRFHVLQDYDFAAVNTPQYPQLTWDAWARERDESEEINIISPKDGSYDWILGYYYETSKIDVHVNDDGATGLGGPPIYIYEPVDKTTTGEFGQFNLRFSPRWELGVGLRYSSSRTEGPGFVALNVPTPACALVGLPAAPFNGCAIASLAGSESDSRATGKVSLNYKPNGSNLLYAFVARGYKPGGFTSPTSNFAPETVIDLELGWKASFADEHVRTQLGGFHYDYHDFQLQGINLTNGALGVMNLPTATIYGSEATVQTQFGGWSTDAGVSYVHSQLPGIGLIVNQHLLPPGLVGTAGPQCAAGQSTGCFNYGPFETNDAGGPNLYSPEWTFNAGLSYRFMIADGVSATPRLNYAYVGGQFVNVTYSRTTDYLPAHGLLSALVSFDIHDHWTAQLYGTNLTNKVYPFGQVLTTDDNYTYGPPRQYGARIGYSF